MNVSQFLQNIRKIAAERPTYRTGGDGSDGTCDCIGLIMGALGGKFDLHSSNYFARCQMHTLDALQDESQLHEGSIVYKSRRDTAQLNARYLEGGRYYTGDLLDYYHVGVVTGIDPLEITHCTQSGTVDGITYDGSIRAWSHFGDLLDVELRGNEEEISMAPYTAIVTARSGSNVRMRSRPDDGAPTVTKVPLGQTVRVMESASGWAKVDWDGQRGYMMAEFLLKTETSEEGSAPCTDNIVTITLPMEAAKAILAALEGVM